MRFSIAVSHLLPEEVLIKCHVQTIISKADYEFLIYSVYTRNKQCWCVQITILVSVKNYKIEHKRF